MTHRLLLVPAIALALNLGSPAAAQSPAPPPMDETPYVDDLVVRAFGGPAWWTVSDGDSKVYILGMQGGIVKGAPWEKTRLTQRLTGAKKLILPMTGYDPKPSPADLLTITRYRLKMSFGKPVLEASLPPDMRAQFVKYRTLAGQPEQRYGTLPVGAATMMLAGDLLPKLYPPQKGPPGESVQAQVVALAKARKVRLETPPYTGPKLGYNKLISDLLKPGQACTGAILNALDRGGPPRPSIEAAIKASQDWAEGDIRGVLRAIAEAERQPKDLGFEAQGYRLWIPPGAYDACVAEMPNTRGRIGEVNPVADTTAAIERQLKTPGHAVALVYPYPLLRRDGVLDRLRRKGFTVTTPAGG